MYPTSGRQLSIANEFNLYINNMYIESLLMYILPICMPYIYWILNIQSSTQLACAHLASTRDPSCVVWQASCSQPCHDLPGLHLTGEHQLALRPGLQPAHLLPAALMAQLPHHPLIRSMVTGPGPAWHPRDCHAYWTCLHLCSALPDLRFHSPIRHPLAPATARQPQHRSLAADQPAACSDEAASQLCNPGSTLPATTGHPTLSHTTAASASPPSGRSHAFTMRPSAGQTPAPPSLYTPIPLLLPTYVPCDPASCSCAAQYSTPTSPSPPPQARPIATP